MRLRVLGSLMIVAFVLLSGSSTSYAGEPISDSEGYTLKDKSPERAKEKPKHGNGSTSGGGSSAAKTEAARRQEEVARYKRYTKLVEAVATCRASRPAEDCPAAPTPPGSGFGQIWGVLDPAITDEEAAHIAFARLRLKSPTPVVGPSPDLNPWKMAAVGYPLWLSVAGDPDPPPVSDAVADVRVRLQAHVTKVVFSMGDRHTVSCTHFTTRWTSGAAGHRSPVCGYTYQKPSLPRGDYTVTATTYWSVAWETSRERGVIPFVQATSSQLPVGELQVLNR